MMRTHTSMFKSKIVTMHQSHTLNKGGEGPCMNVYMQKGHYISIRLYTSNGPMQQMDPHQLALNAEGHYTLISLHIK